MQPGHSQLVPALIVVAGASIWGLLWLPLRALEEAGMGPLWSIVAFHSPSMVVACIVFAVCFRSSSGRMALTAVAGVLAGLSIASYCLSLVMTSVIRATMLFYLMPVWGTLIGMAWLGERPGPARALVLVLGTSGLLLLLGAFDSGGIDGGIGLGEVLGLLSGVFWAMAASILNKYKDLPVTGVNFFQYLAVIGAVAASALFLPFGEVPDGALSWEPAVFMWMASSLLILVSVYSILYAISFLPPGRSGLLMMSEVVVAVFSASILLPEETLKPLEWAGAGVIVLAALIEIGIGLREDRPVQAESQA